MHFAFFDIIYDTFLLLLATLVAPKLLYQWLRHDKYRNSLGQRLGIGFPGIKKGNKKLIWVHAVSLGETKAVAALVKKIKLDNPEILIVCSSVTETGYAESKKNIPEVDFHVFLPLDFSWIIKPIVKRINPDIVILCETDFWYNFLKCSKDQGASVFLVNGKISQRSLDRFKKYPAFKNRLFTLIDAFCLQNEHYKQRFIELGVAEERIHVTGNMKFDGDFTPLPSEKLKEWKIQLGISANDFVIVAGSTHHPEEKLILDALKSVWDQISDVVLILVPRHPERFKEVAGLLEKLDIPFKRYSEINDKKDRSKVILIDSMGLLKQCYQIADLAIVAGSYTERVGGHNIIEPSWYGIPVIYGPYMHSQPELVELVQGYNAGLMVKPENLTWTLLELLKDVSERERMQRASKKMVSELHGATQKTYNVIFNCISK